MLVCAPGDILLYRSNGLTTTLIEFGEILEDGKQDREYVHVAIALNANWKIEADSKRVAIHPIDYDNCDVFRPPIPKPYIQDGLAYLHLIRGERYDWWLIIDDALRYLTFDLIHLPKRFIEWREKHEKICSSLVAAYFRYAGWSRLKRYPPPSPEDIYLAVRDYEVKI